MKSIPKGGLTMADNKIISIPDGKICDYVDGKFRNDTPEEYVRQTIEKRLINEHKYDATQIKIDIRFSSVQGNQELILSYLKRIALNRSKRMYI